MRIDLYSIDQRTGEEMIEARNVELRSLFQDDPDNAAEAERALALTGETYYGGGAAALYCFRRIA